MQKVQSSALLLEKQRNPGIGYWAGGGGAAPNGSVSRVSIADSLEGGRRTSSDGPPASDAGTAAGPEEEEVNLEVRRSRDFASRARRRSLTPSHAPSCSTCATSFSSSSNTRRCGPTSSACCRSSSTLRRRRRAGSSPASRDRFRRRHARHAMMTLTTWPHSPAPCEPSKWGGKGHANRQEEQRAFGPGGMEISRRAGGRSGAGSCGRGASGRGQRARTSRRPQEPPTRRLTGMGVMKAEGRDAAVVIELESLRGARGSVSLRLSLGGEE